MILTKSRIKVIQQDDYYYDDVMWSDVKRLNEETTRNKEVKCDVMMRRMRGEKDEDYE